MKKIILIGVPNAGKSTLGRLLADVMKLPFYDTDTMTCDKLDIARPADLFRMALNGEFAEAQSRAMNEFAALEGPAVISTGAEVALAPDCACLLKKMGIVIHIRRNPEILLDYCRKHVKSGLVRIENDGTKTFMAEEAIGLYAQDISTYEALADYSFENNGTQEEGLKKLINLVNSAAACGVPILDRIKEKTHKY